jgi:hypothetical protein
VVIEHSWLHDNYIAHLADPSLAHTGGVFPYGGSGPLEISHNRLEPGVDAYTGVEVPNYWKAITAVLFTQSSGGSTLQNYNVHDNFISLGALDCKLQRFNSTLGTFVHFHVVVPDGTYPGDTRKHARPWIAPDPELDPVRSRRR